jgi:hypothetical protein
LKLAVHSIKNHRRAASPAYRHQHAKSEGAHFPMSPSRDMRENRATSHIGWAGNSAISVSRLNTDQQRPLFIQEN